MKIGNREISPEGAAFVIAEIGANHNGDMDLARKLIDAAVDEGTTVLVDAIAPNAAIASKLIEVRDELIVSFTQPISDQGLIAAGVGVALMVLGTLLLRRRSRCMRGPQQPMRPWERAEGAHARGVVDGLRDEIEG